MKALLDTHTFLMWLFNDRRLSERARDAIRNPENRLLVSSVTAWEITTKHRLGRLPEAAEVARDVPGWITRARFEPLSVDVRHAARAGGWAILHTDPFDRLLAAQAEIERLPLVTDDRVFERFGLECVW